MTMAPRLAGKLAVITGANQGIGRAIALAFAEQGADLFLLDKNTHALGEIVQKAEGHGVKARFEVLDVTDQAGVDAAMATATQGAGGLDILVNNAGIFQSAKFLDHTLEDWRRTMAVNVEGVFLCTQAALRHMLPRGRGKIVNLSSIAGKSGAPLSSAYHTSKHAVIGLTRSVAAEMAAQGITVNAICPGLIDTEMFDHLLAGHGELMGGEDPEKLRARLLQNVPIGRMIQPQEIAALAVYLASSESDGMTGQALTLSGGRLMI